MRVPAFSESGSLARGRKDHVRGCTRAHGQLTFVLVISIAAIPGVGCYLGGVRGFTDQPLGVKHTEQYGMHLPVGLRSGPMSRGEWAVPFQALVAENAAFHLLEASLGIWVSPASSGEWAWDTATEEGRFHWFTYVGGGASHLWVTSQSYDRGATAGAYLNCGLWCNLWGSGVFTGVEFRYTFGTSARVDGTAINLDGPQLMLMLLHPLPTFGT